MSNRDVRYKTLSKLVERSPGRYREDHGLGFDDFEVGDIYEHRPGRTVTEAAPRANVT